MSGKTISINAEGAFRIVLAIYVLSILIRPLFYIGEGMEILAGADTDDIMRFLEVRDWLAGQAWYDMQQYRVQAPEGISMHWSRYLDVALGGMIGGLGWIMPTAAAEDLVILYWPRLLLAALVVVTAFGTRRLFGPLAAIFAVMSLLFWPLTAGSYFDAGRLDHHNIQILLGTITALTLTGRDRHVTRGLIGGAAAALSLAIGLEMLVVAGLAGVLLTLRAAGRGPEDMRQALAYAGALAVLSALLFIGQNPRAEWALARCDELSLPILRLAALGLGVVLTTALAARLSARPAVRLGALGASSAIAFLLALPALQICAAGPYGALPPEIQHLMATRITEAIPATVYMLRLDPVFFSNVGPALAALTIVSVISIVEGRRAGVDPVRKRAVAALLMIGWAGLMAACFQIRLIAMAAPVIPVLTGYALATMAKGLATPARRQAAVGLLAGGMSTFFLPTLSATFLPALTGTGLAAPDVKGAKDCREREDYLSLAAFPPGVVLAPANFGPRVLLATGHTVLAAPYHRSAEAMSQGLFPLEAEDDAVLRNTLAETGSDYLLLCRDAIYGVNETLARKLARGEEAEGFRHLLPAENSLVFLEVVK